MNDFINRINEISDLSRIITNINEPKVIILKGDSGYGKSELTRRLLSLYEKHPAIKVEIDYNEAYASGYYLAEITKGLFKTINKLSFDQALNDFISIKQADETALSLLRSFGKDIPILKNIIISGESSERQYAEFQLLKEGYVERIDSVLMKELLTYVLQRQSFVLNIENIQCIDHYSLEALVEILKECFNYVIILEFTPGKEKNHCYKLIEKFEEFLPKDNINIYPIQKLSDAHILELYCKKSDKVIEFLKTELIHWNGNIHSIKDAVYTIAYDCQTIGINEGTASRIESNPQLKDWLHLVACESGETRLDDLYALGMTNCVLETLDPFVAVCDNESVKIKHDTIKCYLSQDSKRVRSALQTWYQYYRNNKSMDPSSKLYKSFQFAFLLNNMDSIVGMLDDIKNLVVHSIDPWEHIKVVEKIYYDSFVETIDDEVADKILLWIIEMYQNLCDYKKAYGFLEQLKSKGKNYIVLKALLLYQCGHHESALNFCNQKINEFDDDNHLCLVLRIIRLEINYVLSDQAGCDRDFKHIESNKRKYQEYFEYGFFLRNAELIKSYSAGIPYYEASIKHFKKFNAMKQEASSLQTLGIHYALIGRFFEAEETFNEVCRKQKMFIGMEDMLLNNQAVIMIYKGETDTAEHKLYYARRLAVYDFNKLAIDVNLMTIRLRKKEQDDGLVKDMLDIIAHRTFQSERIRQYTYILLFKYYTLFENPTLAKKYYDKIIEFSDIPSYLYKWISNKELAIDDPDYFRTRIENPVSFICEWSLEYDSNLMQFE